MIVNRPVIIQSNVDFAKKSDVQGSSSIPSAVNFLRTMGLDEQGDGGGSLYTRQATEPAHEGKIQDSNSSWWGISPNGQGYLKVLSFAGADLGAKFNAAVEAVLDMRESPDGLSRHQNINGILIPPGLYDLEEAMEINTCTNLSVWAYGAQIRNFAGAFHALKIVYSENVSINGLKLDYRGNNVADEAVMVAGTCSWLKLSDLAVQANSSNADFACVRLKQGDAGGFDDDDRAQGSFWVTIDRFWCRKLAGGDSNDIPIGIDAQGCQNALRITNSSINNATTGVLVQNQNGSTASGISNDVQIVNTAFETGTTAIKWSTTDSGDAVAGGAIIGCRFENLTTCLVTDGFAATPSQPITMMGNTIISSVTNYVDAGGDLDYQSFDSSVTPNFVYPQFAGRNGLFIRNVPVASGVPGLRVIATGAANGGSIALARSNGTTIDGLLSQRTGGGMDINSPSSSAVRVAHVLGISGSGTYANNLRGTVTVSELNTTATVTFSTNESDASFQVVLTAKSSTGTPAAGSNRVLSYTTATTGFTITVEAAPDTGNTVTFSWILIR
jgi:hypothetical protein